MGGECLFFLFIHPPKPTHPPHQTKPTNSENGIYARLGEYNLPDPQCMFDINFFRSNPVPFFSFSRELLPGNFKPSVSHLFIRQLEEQAKLLRCYTQNIDSLELVAGLSNDRLLQCHGSFETATCLKCKAKYTLEDIRAQINAQEVPMCELCVEEEEGDGERKRKEGIIKPDIVFFGESLGDRFARAMEHDKNRVDLLLVMVRLVSFVPFHPRTHLCVYMLLHSISPSTQLTHPPTYPPTHNNRAPPSKSAPSTNSSNGCRPGYPRSSSTGRWLGNPTNLTWSCWATAMPL